VRERKLRKALIRLAYERPDSRSKLLAVLAKALSKAHKIPRVPGVAWVEELGGKVWIGLKRKIKPQRVEHIRTLAKGLLHDEGAEVKKSTTKGGKSPTKGFADIFLEYAPARTASQLTTTILDQMGGVGRIRAMTGAHSFVDHGDAVSFLFPNRQRSRGNSVKITLDRGRDTYNMEFFNVSIRGAKKVKTFKDVGAEQLAPLFSKQTGLHLRLV